jgi:GNAT superfamily N-acetyltransferase
MEIRVARPADAPGACHVMRRSISELCIADHHNDPEILRRWLANKTPEIVTAWIANPNNIMLLAVEGDAILAVGLVTNAGEVQLNYVSPDARFRGISRALMQALEVTAREHGVTTCTLISTETAHRFYHSIGYVEVGTPSGKFGTAGSYPMSKTLT